jgi:hypothetical protein
MTAPIASGWSEIAGWALHPLESAAFSRRTPEAVVSVVAIVGASANRGCGKTRSQRRRVGSNIQRNGLPAHPGTQARTACSNGDAEDRDRPLHVVGQNVKAHRGSHPIECPGQELAATHP